MLLIPHCALHAQEERLFAMALRQVMQRHCTKMLCRDAAAQLWGGC